MSETQQIMVIRFSTFLTFKGSGINFAVIFYLEQLLLVQSLQPAFFLLINCNSVVQACINLHTLID